MYRMMSILSAAVGGALLLAGCSYGGSHGPASSVPDTAPMATVSQNAKIPGRLYISNAVSAKGNTVEVYESGTYKHIGEITKGIRNAEGLWVDKAGNLYVANSGGGNVTEYAPGGTTPICTYSKKLVGPIDETTDDAGNVYVVDFNHDQSPGYIDEYKQCSNAIAARYPIVTPPEGVAVDAQGDVFVSYTTVAGGAFEEFKVGQTTPMVLRARTSDSPAGLVLDGKGNLISDQQGLTQPHKPGTIAVIAPPYKKVTTFVTGLGIPFRLALNREQTLLFDVDTFNEKVSIYQYPSGKLVKTLGVADGVTNPGGVAISPNAVF